MAVRLRPIVLLFVVVLSVIGVSMLSNYLWRAAGEKPEGAPTMSRSSLVYDSTMSVASFGEANAIPRPVLKQVFGLNSPEELGLPVAAFGMNKEQLLKKTLRTSIVSTELAARNWVKIPLKFVLWALFLGMALYLARHKCMTRGVRTLMMGSAVVVFGIVLGSDPNPMGTVKDAITLYGAKGVIFAPRMVALGIFLVMVVVANKFICTWGCQFGTLQDVLFGLNRNAADTASGVLPQYKLPFVLTNTIRVLFFVTFSTVAFVWGVDMVSPLDPFKVFSPLHLGITGVIAVAVLAVVSLFVYRPWCHLLCPFGLVGWVFEKLSVFRIRVNHALCVKCGACERACPTTVMGAILRDEKVKPDCFACQRCVQSCAVGAVTFSHGMSQAEDTGRAEKS